MAVSKHRRRAKPAPRQPDRSPTPSPQTIATIDALREAIASPALDFPARAIVAGTWWYQQLLRKVGDRHYGARLSWKDQRRAAVLLCVAMDGEHGDNDDLSPLIAAMVRPYCPARTFTEAWEQTNRLPPGTAAATVARILNPSGKPAA